MQSCLDIVVPCYNEEQNITLFFEEAIASMLPYMENGTTALRFIFVDDGSQDNTLQVIKALKHTPRDNVEIKYLSFSKNFGKEAALLAGLRESTGDFTAVMDADMQHPPALLATMYNILTSQDCDCVGTKRSSRKNEHRVRSFLGKFFYKIINRISDVEIVQDTMDFRMMKRHVAQAILSMPERKRFTKGIYSWVGFKTVYIEFENVVRAEGSSKWSYGKLVRYAMDGITSFSTAPLRIATGLGLCFSVIAVIYGVTVFIRTLLYGSKTAGYPTIVLLILFIGGVLMMLLGITGEYIARIFEEVKQRPHYVIKETNCHTREGDD